MRLLGLNLLAGFLLVGCAVQPSEPPAAEDFSQYRREEQAIYLAVLDAMFDRWKAEGRYYKIPVHYFISINQHDAPYDLLSLLHASGYRVDIGSRWREGNGVELSMETIKWKNSTRVVVYGGYLFGSLGGEWGPFVLVKRAGKWRVLDWTADMMA